MKKKRTAIAETVTAYEKSLMSRSAHGRPLMEND